MPAAILAGMFVPGEDGAAVEVQMLLGNAVEIQQPNHAGSENLEIDAANPIFVRLFAIDVQFAEFEPGFEGIVREPAFFEMDDFGQIAIEQAESPADIDDMHRHVQAVQDQNAGAECYVGGGRE